MSEEYIKVFTDNSILVQRLNNLLREEGIISRISDRVESARLGGFGVPTNSVELFVLKTDLAKATKVIEKFKAQINA